MRRQELGQGQPKMARFRFRIRTAMIVIAELAVVLGLLILALRHDDTMLLALLVIFLAAISHFIVRRNWLTPQRP
jgi:hypothetical protein